MYRFFSYFKRQGHRDRQTLWLFCAIASICAGCANSSTSDNRDFLIRVRDSVVTVGDYKKAFEIAKSAYSHNDMQDPAAFKAVQQRLLDQLTVELVLIERAKELGIRVTDTDVEAAVQEIKSDYPDGEFEKMLLENAVSYPIWKQRLRRRMLMEKVIEAELKLRITIEPDEILAYYDEHIRSQANSASIYGDPNAVIVMQLRREQAEEAYLTWIHKLEKEYSIEINQAEWKKIVTF